MSDTIVGALIGAGATSLVGLISLIGFAVTKSIKNKAKQNQNGENNKQSIEQNSDINAGDNSNYQTTKEGNNCIVNGNNNVILFSQKEEELLKKFFCGNIIENNKIEIDKNLAQRSQIVQSARAYEKQRNLERILVITLELLKNQEWSIKNISTDWVNNFVEYAENVSDQDLQKLWAKILAGEVKNPKSFSLRSLQTLKNLSTDEAKLFLKFSSFVCKYNSTLFVIGSPSFWEINGFSGLDISILNESGLLSSVEGRAMIDSKTKLPLKLMNIGKYEIWASCAENLVDFNFDIYPLTKSGSDLYEIVKDAVAFNHYAIVDFLQKANRNIEFTAVESTENF